MINNQLSVLKERLRSGILLIVIFAVFSTGFSNSALAQEVESESDFNAGEMIMHHIVDSHVWHLWDGHYGTIYLPIIVYSSERGVDVFMSSNFYDDHHNTVAYNGYLLEHEHISFEQGEGKVYDFSITKNVASLLVNALVMVLVFMAVARGYKKNVGKGPTGIQSFFEPIIVYIRDEIVKPNIGKGYEKYLPYLLTLFFFYLVQ